MELFSSKLKFNFEDLLYLDRILEGELSFQSKDGLPFIIAEDARLIHFSLQKKLSEKLKANQSSCVMELHSLEMLYILAFLEAILPYLNTQAAEYQNYLFDHRQESYSSQYTQVKENYHQITAFQRSLCRIMDRIQWLQKCYADHFAKIFKMGLEERVNILLSMDGESPPGEGDNIIYIHKGLQ